MTPQVLRIYKADDILIDKPVEGCEISITYPLPTFEQVKLEEYQKIIYNKEAECIFTALRDNLPGGTFDQLLLLMLEEKASHLRVSYGNK